MVLQLVYSLWTLVFGGFVIFAQIWYLQTREFMPPVASEVAILAAIFLSFSYWRNAFSAAYLSMASGLVGAFLASELRMHLVPYTVMAAFIGWRVAHRWPSFVAAILAASAMLSVNCSRMVSLDNHIDRFPNGELLVLFAAFTGVVWWREFTRLFLDRNNQYAGK